MILDVRDRVNDRLGMRAFEIRQHRMVGEALATAGDLRRVCDYFGVTMATAQHYASVLNHPGLATVDQLDPATDAGRET